MAVRESAPLMANPFSSARADVRHAERDEFLIGIEIVAVLHGEAPRGHHRAVETDEGEAGGSEEQLTEIRRANRREHQRRKPGGNRADQRDAAAAQIEYPCGKDADNDADERRRDLFRESLDAEQQRIHTHADNQRRQMRLPELRDELPDQTKESLGLQRKSEQLSELPADDAEGDPVEIPGQDRGARERW